MAPIVVKNGHDKYRGNPEGISQAEQMGLIMPSSFWPSKLESEDGKNAPMAISRRDLDVTGITNHVKQNRVGNWGPDPIQCMYYLPHHSEGHLINLADHRRVTGSREIEP
jgi:hypothetical protein